MQKLRLFLITLSHFCVDSYATLLQPLLPLLKANLGLSLAQTGFLGTIVSICNISQPLLGLWADRMGRRWLIVGGLVLTTIFAPLMGLAPNYLTLILVLALSGIGVAAFHPPVFSLAGELSAPRRAFGLALFIFGGTLGLGLAPLWAPSYTQYFGLENLPYISLDNPNFTNGKSDAQWRNLGEHTGPLILITAIVIIRSVSSLGFGTFLALLAQERGLDLVAGGIPLGIYNIAGVAGALLLGYLADRFNPKPLIWGSLLLSVPPLYAFIYAESVLASNILLFLGGGLLMASNSVMVSLAQELSPENSGLASSLPLGFSWGMASLTLPLIGYFGDQIGVAETLKYLALLPLLSAGLAFFLSGHPRTKDPA